MKPQFTVALFLALIAPLFAQTVTKPAITLELAKKVAAAAEAEAAKNKWTMVIVVIDDGGNAVFLERMDGTQLGSIEVAEKKAHTALFFKRPTKSYEDAVASGRTAILTVPGIIAIQGGIPLTKDGTIIGAIGVSGMQPDQDNVVAQAGVAALAQ
jgi:glc operon protein GlcG